jgi:hypothetical protein
MPDGQSTSPIGRPENTWVPIVSAVAFFIFATIVVVLVSKFNYGPADEGPLPVATATATASPSGSPDPSAGSTSGPTAGPTAAASASPSAAPTASASPTP